jgi:ribonuclease P protein component
LPLSEGETSPARTGFSVPKKKFRLSVHRHRIIRLLREAWRLNKHELYAVVPYDKQVHIFFIFTGKEMPEYKTVQEAVLKAIEKLKQVIISSSFGGGREEVSNA